MFIFQRNQLLLSSMKKYWAVKEQYGLKRFLNNQWDNFKSNKGIIIYYMPSPFLKDYHKVNLSRIFERFHACKSFVRFKGVRKFSSSINLVYSKINYTLDNRNSEKVVHTAYLLTNQITRKPVRISCHIIVGFNDKKQ